MVVIDNRKKCPAQRERSAWRTCYGAELAPIMGTELAINNNLATSVMVSRNIQINMYKDLTN